METKTETLTIRTTPEAKKRFNEAKKANANLFEEHFEAFETVANEAPMIETEEIAEAKPEPVEVLLEVTKTETKSLLSYLNPVQLFALTETLLNKEGIDSLNATIKKVNEGNGYSFFTDLFDGTYKGVFTPIEMSNNTNEAESMLSEKNMISILVNVFMAYIVSNGNFTLETPVDKNSIREFLNDKVNG